MKHCKWTGVFPAYSAGEWQGPPRSTWLKNLSYRTVVAVEMAGEEQTDSLDDRVWSHFCHGSLEYGLK